MDLEAIEGIYLEGASAWVIIVLEADLEKLAVLSHLIYCGILYRNRSDHEWPNEHKHQALKSRRFHFIFPQSSINS